MANDSAELLAQSDATVAALIEDGADPDTRFTIEHHLVSADFTKLEKAAVELVKAGYHVDDADEFELDDGSRLFAFAAVSEVKLDAELLRQQTKEVCKIADLAGVEYDGWGTFFGEADEEE
ncbi:ribonuclease E inhibitor RraB [Pseudidiomarina insulisalsae]|uniref:Ribonuclease E inhibitor RraB n=1 Tax=Pseudidiomarina insulisalsae TaxID=575789 RepID=A0A432YHV0_9GAMM|nr:ribonuclease E inhibitor RraB [Pseudidiomarina insulisalsae]RUO60514.1 ribonuclease E inhibitor RraB [Pseudidiomarina insulisalsae]